MVEEKNPAAAGIDENCQKSGGEQEKGGDGQAPEGGQIRANTGGRDGMMDDERAEEEETEVEPVWPCFKQWVHCFCVVNFDLEMGQTIEVVYPGNAQLSQAERSDLCYLAFPDSNCPSTNNTPSSPSSSSTDSSHHFRLRRSSIEQLDKHSDTIAQLLPPPLQSDANFFYGFAHFRRQRDPTILRGYSQKSIVLLTRLPFVALFSRVLTEVALAYFGAGENAIERACRQIGEYWPPPVPGGDRLLSLPLFELRFCCSIPAADCNAAAEGEFAFGNFEGPMKTSAAILPKRKSFDEGDGEYEMIDYLHCNIIHLKSIYEPDHHFHVGIKRVLHHLHLLWELVLLGEPLLILAPSPALSSSLVHSLISLISPLRYNGHYRPYFTIHDSDFNEMCTTHQNGQLNSCILGVTNPFFLKTLSHWPHVLKLNYKPQQMHRRERSESRLVRQIRAQPAAQFVLNGLKRSGTASRELDQQQSEEEMGGDGEQKLIKRLSDRAQLDHRSGGFLCAHKQFLVADKTLPRKLLRTPSDSSSQWSMLRWYFAELTQSFMSPLESYISTLLPLRRELSPFQPVPQMRPFSLDQFLGSLRHFGHPGVKGDWQGLYRQFVGKSPNFIGWLCHRQRDIERQLRLEHMDIICNAQFSVSILGQRSQVEIVDLVLKLTNRLAELDHRQNMTMKGSKPTPTNRNNQSPMKDHLENQKARLQQQFNQILASVEDELKMVLLSNNQFRKTAECGQQK